MPGRSLALAALLGWGCAAPPGSGVLDPPAPADPTAASPTPATVATTSTSSVPEPPEPPGPLEITFLGVGGYLIRHGSDAVMTPPMYTNPDFFETTLGTVRSDPELVEQFSADLPLEGVRAVLVGHAHYDHLMDAPTLWPRTGDATFYGNATMAHLLAAFAPDRDPSCDGVPAQDVVIPRDRVVAFDDPEGAFGRDLVDYRMCPELDPGTGDGEGAWVYVDGANVRIRALCSMHPDQVGPIHFAPGALRDDPCEPPERADDWVEGLTLAFLVDFLDPATGAPVHRVYYQDAPTEVPVGLFAPELLREKAVDVALLNVGSYPSVSDHPGATLRLMRPRYTIGGHWEDFFRTQDQPLWPIIGHDIDAYAEAALAALPEAPEPAALVDGERSDARGWVPDPGTTFAFLPQ